LFDEDFRKLVETMSGDCDSVNIGIILSGGNTSIDAILKLFGRADF
jgi:threonine dehydratase